MDGLELGKKIKGDKKICENLPMIMLTSVKFKRV